MPSGCASAPGRGRARQPRALARDFLEHVSGGRGPAEARLAAFLGRPWSTAALEHEIAALWTER